MYLQSLLNMIRFIQLGSLFILHWKGGGNMHKNLMGKLIKSNNVNRGEYTYIYGGSELVDIVTKGGKQYSRNTAFDGRFDENA